MRDFAGPSDALSVVVVAGLTLLGVALRLEVAHQSLFADELSTYWIVTGRGLGGVWSIVSHRDPSGATAEISPPLYFMAAWLTTQLGHTAELVRGPSLVAGALSIPVVYLLGLRTAGRPAALVAAALTALSPFMIYYSAEARPYALMMLLVMLSTLAMLAAVDEGRARWWVLYALASCAAVYTHYTCIFVLGAQLLWLLWQHPEAWKPAVLGNLGAVVAFAPWIPGLRNQLRSTTTGILSLLTPFSAHDVTLSLTHWAIGSPVSSGVVPLRELPGTPALLLLGLAIVAAVGGLGLAAAGPRPRLSLNRMDRRLLLVVALALSVPVGEAIVSAASTHLFGTRNLAASWPGFALALAALLVAPAPRLRLAASGLAIACFGIGAAKMLDERYQRPNFQAIASYINRQAVPGDTVIDETVFFSPGPLSPLDVSLNRHLAVFRASGPAERSRPSETAIGSSPCRRPRVTHVPLDPFGSSWRRTSSSPSTEPAQTSLRANGRRAARSPATTLLRLAPTRGSSARQFRSTPVEDRRVASGCWAE